MRVFSSAMAALCLAVMASAARAQQDLEPAVQTSPSAASATSPTNAAPTAAPAVAPAAVTGAPASSIRRSREPSGGNAAAAAAKPATAPLTRPAAASAASKGGKSTDRIELDTTQISGNRELPKVMYVVPWRRADPGEFTGRPLNSLLDEALTPVDRDVFRRQNRYYAAVSGASAASDKSQPGTGGEGTTAPTPKDEK